jgi:hypothetical protein
MFKKVWEYLRGPKTNADQLKLRPYRPSPEEYRYAVKAKDVDGEVLDIGQSTYRLRPQANGELLLDMSSSIPGMNYVEEVRLLIDGRLNPRRLSAKIQMPRGHYEVDVRYEGVRLLGEVTAQSKEKTRLESHLRPATYDSYENIEILRRWDYGRCPIFDVTLVNVVKGAYNLYRVKFNGLGPLRIDDTDYEAFKVSMERADPKDRERFVQYYWFWNEPPYPLLKHVKAAQILELTSQGR